MKLSLASQDRLDATTVDVSSQPPSSVWQSIATTDRFKRHLIGSVRNLLADTRYYDWVPTLREAGVTTHNGRYAQLIAWLDRPPEHEHHQDALAYTASLGQGQSPTYSTLDDAISSDLGDGPLAILAAAEVEPTIAVHLDKTAFAERPRQQREATLELLAVLDQQCDVHLICTGLTARWLANTHRSVLPIDFDEQLHTERGQECPAETVVENSLRALNPDGGPVKLLRVLAAEPTETLPQASLSTLLCRDASTISGYLSTLEDLSLIDQYSVGAENHVALLKTGSAVLDRLDAEIGQQAELNSMFGVTGNARKRPCNPAPTREGEALPSQQLPTADDTAPTLDKSSEQVPYATRFLNRTAHDSTAALATAGAITVSRGNVADSRTTSTEDLHTRGVSYDSSRDEAVVAVRATTSLQYITSVALSLASPRLFDQALPVDRLDNIDLSPFLLRSARCVGCLSSEAEDDPQVLRDNLVEWGEELAEMTTDLKNGDYDDRDRFRSEIMRSAHGLAGSIAHLLDVAGVDLVRELRIPNTVNEKDIAEIAETVSTAVAIQSSYGHYATYRQLFEDREVKIQSALSPDVDAADPYGEYVGSMVVRCPSPDRVVNPLTDRLSDPVPVRDDAPEIAVQIPVRTADRSDYVAVFARVGERKHLKKTREAVTLCRTLVSDPWAVASALNRLDSESKPRAIRLDEVRVALSRLEPEQLLPEATPTVSKAVAALLRSARPLSKTELAEKADVSARSLRTAGNLDALVALDLVRETDDGKYRFALPFATDDERGDQTSPTHVEDEHVTARDLLYDVVLAIVGDPARTGDPNDPLGEPFFGPGLGVEPLQQELSWIDPWIRVVRLLCGNPPSTDMTVTFGASIEQTAIHTQSSHPAD